MFRAERARYLGEEGKLFRPNQILEKKIINNLDLTVETKDGRKLMVRLNGDPKGRPVFFLHGTPGCRLGPTPDASWLKGVLLVSYDRPGYGGSDRKKGRKFSDTAKDVKTIANAVLGKRKKFRVIGRSGGSLHALACAALLPKRVEKAAILGSLAPIDAKDFDWFEGMNNDNVEAHTKARKIAEGNDPDGSLSNSLIETLQNLASTRGALFKNILSQADPADVRYFRHQRYFQEAIIEIQAEAIKHGVNGWYDDILTTHSKLGFNLRRIKQDVLIAHGNVDSFSPVSHAKWLSRQIPNSVLNIWQGYSHFSTLAPMDYIINYIAYWDEIRSGKIISDRSNWRNLYPEIKEPIRDGRSPETALKVPDSINIRGALKQALAVAKEIKSPAITNFNGILLEVSPGTRRKRASVTVYRARGDNRPFSGDELAILEVAQKAMDEVVNNLVLT